MFFTRLKYLIIIAVSGLIVSCTPGSCFEETDAFLKANLYLSETGKLLAPDSLTIYGLDISSLPIYNKTTGVITAQVPLDPAHESCGFSVRINGITDTFTVWYSSFPHLVSKECGYTFFHVVDSVTWTTNIIDDIIIKNRNVTVYKEENIRIFY